MTVIRPIPVPADLRILKACMAGGLLCGLIIIYLVPPADLPLTACAFHSITGHSCLTCGMTRSLHSFAHGDWAGAIRYHLLGPAIFVGMLLSLMILAAEVISGRKSAVRIRPKIRNRAAVAFAVVWLVYWGARLAVEFAT